MTLENRINQTFICSVIFADIVGYSKAATLSQRELKRIFEAQVRAALHDVEIDSRIVLDTGDGVAVGFLWNPESAFRFAKCLRDELLPYSDQLSVRIGAHLGPVQVVQDLNGHPNLVGDGINASQRVMSFAEGGQILASDVFRDAIAHLSEGYAIEFTRSRTLADKHGRNHVVYEVGGGGKLVPASRPELQGMAVPETSSGGLRLAGALIFLAAISAVVLAAWYVWARPTAHMTAPAGSAIGNTGPDESASPAVPEAATAISSETLKTPGPTNVPRKPPVTVTAPSFAGSPAGRAGEEHIKIHPTSTQVNCLECNCPDLLTKLSIGVDPLSEAERRFLRTNCH